MKAKPDSHAAHLAYAEHAEVLAEEPGAADAATACTAGVQEACRLALTVR